MTCLDMEERLAEFLAGELAERSEVEEHLLACADCRAKFSLAKSGWEAAGEWSVAGPSGDAVAATLEAVRTVHPYRATVRLLQAGTIAASLVIALAIGFSKPEARIVETSVPAAAVPASTGLASLQPSVGLLFVRDESGKPAGELSIRRLSVRVDIRDGIARTEIEEVFENRTDLRLEGTFRFPLPPDASISRLAMEIEGKLMEGEVVEREKARQTYEGIVRSMKDPALLEWMPGGIFQCRIFPIEPRSDKRIIIAYTQALSVFDGGGRYVYPLAGESMRELGIGRFEFAATIRSGAKLVKAESTSHTAATIRLDDRTLRTTFAASDFRPGADFVLTFESAAPEEIQVSAHRPGGGESGYFAAFITPRLEAGEIRRDRTLQFLLDTSGSVSMAELEAARVVVRRMIGALHPNDRFRIGCHNLIIGLMPESAAPDEKGKRTAERYLGDLVREGASDLAGAMEAALSFVPDGGELVYIGEGTPTWGENDPAKILARIRQAIGSRKITIRTVAVGSDAEKGLLETIAREFNGGAHAISPSDDVASRADEIARTLGRPAITGLKAQFQGAVTDTAPATLGMVHVGERILVTGRYGPGPATLILTGRVPGREFRREFALTLPEREADNLHVKRLWAQRRLADLVAQGDAKRADAVKLSVEHQVMTPYTSFLVLESEKAYEEHRIERTKKDADQTKDPKVAKISEESRKRQVLETIANLLDQAYTAFDQRRFERAINLCDEVLAIDPQYSVAVELKEDAQKIRHRQEYFDFLRAKVENWKKLTKTNGEAVIPYADTVRLPTADEWTEMSKRSPSFAGLSRTNSEVAKSAKAPSDGERHDVRDITNPKGSFGPVFDGEALAKLIKATIDKTSWNQAEGRDCIFQNGLMIVRNAPEVQRRVERFLTDMRAWSGLHVSVESRFLTIDEDRLQSPQLQIYNVQDMTFGLQDFPGVNPVLRSEELSFPARELWMEVVRQRRPKGILGDDDIHPAFSTLPGQQFASFIDPGGSGGALAGASFTLNEPKPDPAIQEIDKFAMGVGTLSRQLESQLQQIGAWEAEAKAQNLPHLGDLPVIDHLYRWAPADDSLSRMLKAVPQDLRVDGYFTEDSITRPPIGGYDTGGTGVTTLAAKLEDYLKRISELEARAVQERQNRSGADNRALTATQELQYQRQEFERLFQILTPSGERTRTPSPSGFVAGDMRQIEARLEAKKDQLKAAEKVGRDLGTLEAEYQELARERQRLQETIANLYSTGVQTSVVLPRKALSGQVTAVALELDLVVISIGRDAGVNEGDEFTIYRDKTFVGKVTIDRVDRAWASGRVTLKGKADARIGDQATNQIQATARQGPNIPVQQPPPLSAKSDDEVILSGMDPARVRVGGLIVVMRKGNYVATVRALEILHHTVRARILPRLRAGSVSTGDQALPVDSTAELWKLLPESIRREIISERDLAAARLKLLLLRGARGGGK